MARLVVDLRGRRFGRLVIAQDARPSTRKRKAYWPCVCDCGRKKRVRGAHLLAGAVVSCGCWRADGHVRKAAGRMVEQVQAPQSVAAGGETATRKPVEQAQAPPPGAGCPHCGNPFPTIYRDIWKCGVCSAKGPNRIPPLDAVAARRTRR
jgi:hypothetical protein